MQKCITKRWTFYLILSTILEYGNVDIIDIGSARLIRNLLDNCIISNSNNNINNNKINSNQYTYDTEHYHLEDFYNKVGKMTDVEDVVSKDEPQISRGKGKTRVNLWIDGIVPCENTVKYTKAELRNIAAAMKNIHKATCVRFVKYMPGRDKHFMRILQESSGCWANIGNRDSGPTKLNLNSNCIEKVGTVMHELMHVLGFIHEQARPDRDKYVEIIYDNVSPAKLYNFGLQPKHFIDLGLKYDFESITHYSRDTFSRNGRDTIKARVQTDAVKHMGQRSYLSKIDIQKINILYNCGEDPQEKAETRLMHFYAKNSEETDTPESWLTSKDSWLNTKESLWSKNSWLNNKELGESAESWKSDEFWNTKESLWNTKEFFKSEESCWENEESSNIDEFWEINESRGN